MSDLPRFIALCPAEPDEFYYPLSASETARYLAGEPVTCPMRDCESDEPLVVYERRREPGVSGEFLDQAVEHDYQKPSSLRDDSQKAAREAAASVPVPLIWGPSYPMVVSHAAADAAVQTYHEAMVNHLEANFRGGIAASHVRIAHEELMGNVDS